MRKENRGKRMSVRATVTVLLTAAVLMMSLTAAAGAVLYSRLSVYAKQYRFYLEQQNFLQALADYNATAEEYRRHGVFGFSKAEPADGEGYDEIIAAEDVAAYVSENAAYNDYWYYDRLSPDEQLLYKAYEYANDMQMSCVFSDLEAVSSAVNFVKVSQCLALDSSLISQNLWYAYDGPAVTDRTDVSFEDERFGEISVEKVGYRTTVWSFADASSQKTADSITEAQAYVDAAPEFSTQLELAEYLYKELCDDITYEMDYYDNTEALYDTLVGHRSQCDGFSNALSLMYRLCGITCAEKETYDHTWLSFCADGVWYNADPTYDCHYDGDDQNLGICFGFGFSDEYVREKFRYDDIAPECTGNVLYEKARTAVSGEYRENMNKLVASFTENGGQYGIVKASKTDYDSVYDGILAYLESVDLPILPDSMYIHSWEYRSCYIIIVSDQTLWH